MLDFVSIGKQLCAAREALKITQEQAAEIVDVSVETIRNIEHGHTTPSVSTLYALFDLYELPPDVLSRCYTRSVEMNARMKELKIGRILDFQLS